VFPGGSYEDAMNETAAASVAATAPATGGGGGYTTEEVARHTTKGDCWVAVNGQVLNAAMFLSELPFGVLVIVALAGRDATEKSNAIHPPDVLPKQAPRRCHREERGGAPRRPAALRQWPLPPGMSAYTLADVAEHSAKGDCWAVVCGRVLGVTQLLSEHPGGALALLPLCLATSG